MTETRTERGSAPAGTASVVWFGDGPCAEVSVAGGKGASLAAMMAAGLPVPPGFVLPAGALERAVNASELRERARAHDW
ncbi:MAG: pyruvate, water dikinase, partial [Actinomycetota bacterium]|nr:pyruvate, water dikinase [Actinomycetota bacterium]